MGHMALLSFFCIQYKIMHRLCIFAMIVEIPALYLANDGWTIYLLLNNLTMNVIDSLTSSQDHLL